MLHVWFYIGKTMINFELYHALQVSEWLLPDTTRYTAGESYTPLAQACARQPLRAVTKFKMSSKGFIEIAGSFRSVLLVHSLQTLMLKRTNPQHCR